MTARRGLILPVVLVLIGLLAATLASFVFYMRAELAGVAAQRDQEQARLAAESGLEEVLYQLHDAPDDPNLWWNNTAWRHVLVWSEAYNRENDTVRKMGSRKDVLSQASPPVAWRYSVVAANIDGPQDTIRYGLTPESAKLNLNTASEAEIERLFTPLLLDLGVQNAPELVAAFLDWRDKDTDLRAGGAEAEYYNNLVPPYNPKNARLDTLEELLLIKGFTPAVLYGEDVNRNGLLDQNENDGAASFPYYDNGDGILNHGLAAFVTVYSREPRAKSPGGGGGGGGGGGARDANNPQTGGGAKSTLQQRQPTPDEQAALEALQALAAQQGGGDPNSRGGTGDPNDPNRPAGGGSYDPNDPNDPNSPWKEGLININAAPVRVLAALDGMTQQAAEALVAMRATLAPDALKNAQWPVTTGAIDGATYAAIQNRVTTKAYQFHVEILGYADHTKVARRMEWIVELRSGVPQVLYQRDLTSLGLAWPIDEDRYVVVK